MATPRHTPVAMDAVVASIAAVWTPTAASARTSDPDAVISRAGLSARHSGTSAGTSIIPAPMRGGHQEGPERDAGVAGLRADGSALNAAQQTVRRHADEQRTGESLEQRAIHRRAEREGASHDRDRRGVPDGDGQQGTSRLFPVARTHAPTRRRTSEPSAGLSR